MRNKIILKTVITFTFSIIFLFELTSCGSSLKKREMKKVTITNHSIESDFAALPDESINYKKVFEHSKRFPERWNTVFKFLCETDLKTIDLGRIDLNEDVFAVVSEYNTKNPSDAKFESHLKYIDLQYIISGTELIGLTNDNKLEVLSPYNEEKDIAFYNFDGGRMLLASPEKYFIFFPDDIHRPCIKTGETDLVRKIVLKIKND